MAKVITERAGHIKGPWRVDCYKCRSTIEFNPHDRSSDRDGSYYKCPICVAFIAASVVES